MESLSLAAGVGLMLVAATGIVMYIALVVTIPVCRLLDRLSVADEEPPEQRPRRAVRPSPYAEVAWLAMVRIARAAASPLRRPRTDEGRLSEPPSS